MALNSSHNRPQVFRFGNHACRFLCEGSLWHCRPCHSSRVPWNIVWCCESPSANMAQFWLRLFLFDCTTVDQWWLLVPPKWPGMMVFRLPQGCILVHVGPLLFILYAALLSHLLSALGIVAHQYAHNDQCSGIHSRPSYKCILCSWGNVSDICGSLHLDGV